MARYTVELTKREKEMCDCLIQSEGRADTKELGILLGVTTSTARTHLNSIYSKLLINSRSELVYKLCKREDRSDD